MRWLRLLGSLVVLSVFAASFAQSPKVDELRARAKAASEKIAEIVKQGPDASQQSLETLQKFVDELKAIRKELGAIAGTQPKAGAVVGGYMQVQYQSSDRIRGATGPFDAFRIRRTRVNFDADPKDRWHLRASLDTTLGASQNELRLREAWVRYAVPGERPLSVMFGQQAIPIGYELERSSFDIEFPERTVTSTTLFNGEYAPGIKGSYDVTKNLNAQAGLFNSLASQDPEQTDRPSGSSETIGVGGALTYEKSGNRLRVSGFTGERAAYVTSTGTKLPSASRDFLAVDGSLQTVLLRPITLRGEVISGHDRLPLTDIEGPLVGWHVQAALDIDRHNQLAVRYQQLDRNTDTSDDSIVGYGLAYLWRLDKDLKLTLSHEIFVDSLRASIPQRRYWETVLRLSLRF